MKNVTCKCGWVAFEVSRNQAENEVRKFNEYFDTLTEQEKQDWYSGKNSNIQSYESCLVCNGNYKEFKDYKEGDCPMGCTLNPIINRNE